MWAQGNQWGNQIPLDAAAYQNMNHELGNEYNLCLAKLHFTYFVLLFFQLSYDVLMNCWTIVFIIFHFLMMFF